MKTKFGDIVASDLLHFPIDSIYVNRYGFERSHLIKEKKSLIDELFKKVGIKK